jgi:hypothetical protein
MRRRGWIVALGSGLCAGWLPACAPYAASIAVPPPPVPAKEAGVRPEGREAETPQTSPYHQLPPPRPVKPDRTSDGTIEQARYPVPPASRVGPLRGKEPEEPPGPVPEFGPLVPAHVVVESPVRPPPEKPLIAAMQCFLDKRPAEAVERLRRYDKPNQELLLCLLPLAARLTESSLQQADPQDMAAVVEQLQGLETPLRARAALGIDKMCFCRRIERYGVYDPLPDNYAFRPGEPVQLYVELRNFSSELHDRVYVTRLHSRVEAHDYEGRVVWREDFHDADRADVSQTLRHDYFNNYRFCVPDIPPGSYTLWIHVQDVATKRSTRRSLDFRVTTVTVRN